MRKAYFNFDGSRLRTARERNRLSRKDVATATKISIPCLRNYEDSRTVPGIEEVVLLADLLCVSVDWLLGRTDVDGNPEKEFVAARKAAYELWLVGGKSVPIPTGYVSPYPYNLIEEILGKETELPVTNDQVAGLEYALGALPEREENAIRLYYETGMTLEEIGKKFDGVTRERARQIIARGLRRLRHSHIRSYLLYGLEGCNTKIQEKTEASRKQIPNSFDELEIDHLSLSVRGYNCLFKAGLTTIGSVCDAVENGRIYKIRGLGTKTLVDILDCIKKTTGRTYRGTGMTA